MNMQFDNKAEMCEFINEVVKFVPGVTVRKLIGAAKTFEKAVESINESAEGIYQKNYNNAIGTQMQLLAKRYIADDCNGCELPLKWCRCRPIYSCEGR